MKDYSIVSVRMDKNKFRELKRLCEDEERSMSWMLNKAYSEWVKSRKAQQGAA